MLVRGATVVDLTSQAKSIASYKHPQELGHITPFNLKEGCDPKNPAHCDGAALDDVLSEITSSFYQIYLKSDFSQFQDKGFLYFYAEKANQTLLELDLKPVAKPEDDGKLFRQYVIEITLYADFSKNQFQLLGGQKTKEGPKLFLYAQTQKGSDSKRKDQIITTPPVTLKVGHGATHRLRFKLLNTNTNALGVIKQVRVFGLLEKGEYK